LVSRVLSRALAGEGASDSVLVSIVNSTFDTDRRRIVPTIPAVEHPTGHDLIAVEVWLPGSAPSDYDLDLAIGTEYRTRFWRCRACRAERNQPDEFESVCPGWPVEPILTDGGASAEDSGRESEPSSELTAQFLTFGPGYAVETAEGQRYIVDIEDESCSCEASRESSRPCVHLKRVTRAISTGELPGPDGRFVR
jgi:hypothetical protein